MKAYSLLEVKDAQDDRRVIRGIATSPRPDRVGDIVESSGVHAAADIPLFLYHDHQKTVGRAKLGKAGPDGVPFEATLPTVAEPGRLRDRVEEAWQMLRYGLIRAVSIGFRPVGDKYELLKTGGLRFLETEVFELSLVPVPAQPDAVITALKAFDPAARERLLKEIRTADHAARAATGPARGAVLLAPTHRPGASGSHIKLLKA